MHDLTEFVGHVERIVARHAVGSGGAHARWTWQDPFGGRALGINEHGCADAINLLYTIGALPDADARSRLAGALAALQDPATGDFIEATHDPIHATAHCVAALELLDVRPPHRLVRLRESAGADGPEAFLEGLGWAENLWGESHKGAGAYAALGRFRDDFPGFLTGLDPEKEEGLNDLHQLFGAVSAVAELQRALPGTIYTPRPLRLVLDRRPFI